MKWDAEEFYPTPKSLLDKITMEINWKSIQTILEPSAGKGNIVEYCKEQYKRCVWNNDIDIDCIEIDSDLQRVLKGKEFRLVHDDFLTFRTFKHYDLIIMNPPFSTGAKHLLHALSLQKDNFGIICILNAETIRNPCTNERKDLISKLRKLDAEIKYMDRQFVSAEHQTGVEIAVVRVYIPAKDTESIIFQELRKKRYQENRYQDITELAPNDFIKAAIAEYNIEIEAGIELILEYKAMTPHIMNDLREQTYSKPILEMKVSDRSSLSTNAYVREVRRKYWYAFFNNRKITGNMTSNLSKKYYERVQELAEYDFSEYNIRTIQEEMAGSLIKGIENCIIELFDKLSHQHSYNDELKNNIHYYNGWKTNKSWYINKKVIIPYMNAFSRWSGEFSPDYDVRSQLADIERALNYLDGGLTDAWDIESCLNNAEKAGQTKKIRLKYFYVTFYKKGTCHLEFINEDLLKKLNIFGSQQKRWLPQGYGKRKYSEMDSEEKAVIDSFEGRGSYEKTMARASYFIYDPMSSMKMLEMSNMKNM